MGTLLHLEDYRASNKKHSVQTFFARRELDIILSCYSRYVAAGFWRDYAIDHHPGYAVFSIFRKSHEQPSFTIVKIVTGKSAAEEFQVFKGIKRLAKTPQLSKALSVMEKKVSQNQGLNA